MAGLLRVASRSGIGLRAKAAVSIQVAQRARVRDFSTAASRAAVRRSILDNAAPAHWSWRTLYTHIEENGFDEERRLHEHLVAMQYDSERAKQFYGEVMGDGTGMCSCAHELPGAATLNPDRYKQEA
jgi:hypothetical protein